MAIVWINLDSYTARKQILSKRRKEDKARRRWEQKKVFQIDLMLNNEKKVRCYLRKFLKIPKQINDEEKRKKRNDYRN